MRYHKLTRMLLFRYVNRPAALARVLHYLRQPEVQSYITELNRPYAESTDVMRRSQTCYSFGLGITPAIIRAVATSEDPAMLLRLCIQPGMLGGLNALANLLRSGKRDLSKRGAKSRLAKYLVRLNDRRQNPTEQDMRRDRVLLRGITSMILGTKEMRLKLLADGLIETDADAPLADDKRRLYICTRPDDDRSSDYHVYRKGDKAITFTHPDGRTLTTKVWANKRGMFEVSIFDAEGHILIEPEQDKGPRTHMLGYFDVSATPPPLGDVNYHSTVAPQHRAELEKGLPKIVREGILRVRLENKHAPLMLKPEGYQQMAVDFCERHGITVPYLGRLLRPADKRRIIQARKRTPE